MLILIVDDSRAMRRVEREILAQIDGVECIEAEDGVSAVYCLRDVGFSVDLILVDWMMPRMDGLELVRRVKDTPNLSAIPMFMVTSLGDQDKMQQAFDAGVDGYLLKPFTKETFLESLAGMFPDLPANRDSAVDTDDGSPDQAQRLLEAVPREMRRRILEMCVTDEVVAGEEILPLGASVDYLFFVLQGVVEEAVGGSAAAQRRYSPGDCFGVIELLSGDRSSGCFSAVERAVLGRLPKPAFEGMLLRFPELGVTLSRVMAAKAHDLRSIQGMTCARVPADRSRSRAGTRAL